MPRQLWHCSKCHAEFKSKRAASRCEYSHKRMTNFWYKYCQEEEIPDEIVVEFGANGILDRKQKVTYERKIELI